MREKKVRGCRGKSREGFLLFGGDRNLSSNTINQSGFTPEKIYAKELPDLTDGEVTRT